jgi:hypothetical protein
MNLEKYEQIKKNQEILEKQIFVANDCIMINVYREYSIALFRCNRGHAGKRKLLYAKLI